MSISTEVVQQLARDLQNVEKEFELAADIMQQFGKRLLAVEEGMVKIMDRLDKTDPKGSSAGETEA